MKFLMIIIAVWISTAAIAKEPPKERPTGDIRIIKISAVDQTAAIKTSTDKVSMIKVGDQISHGGKVTEITKGRIVIEELTGRGTETVIFRVENGKQTVERINRAPKKTSVFFAPQGVEKQSQVKQQ